MRITELSVKRPVTGVMIFLSLTLAGVYSFARLKLDMLPNIEFPIVAVITLYPGAGPEAIEELVTRPVEAAMSSVENVEEINSTSSQGNSLVMVKFAWGTDMALAEAEVRKNLELYTYDRLPEDISRSLTFAFDPSLQPIMFLTVNAPGSSQEVRTLAEEEIAPAMTRIPGIAAAEIIGGSQREIQVRVQPAWLQAYGIQVVSVVGALRAANVIVPGGNLDQGALELSIVTDAQFPDVEAIRRTVVGQRGGVPVLLRDVADVVDGFEEVTHVVRAEGKSAVMMAVRKQSDANTVQVVRRLYRALDKLEGRLPEGATITAIFDQAEPITRSISNLSTTALAALFFTAMVLLTFLRNWRSSSIAMVSIPLSVLATFMVMAAFDVTLNIISMAGLALAVGMLVDNSIVVLENIFTHQAQGEDPRTAAIKGTAEVAMPITASTLTTVAVFVPVLFVPGLAGQLFRDMALTICFSLGSSLVVTLTLVPLLASLLTRHGKKAFGEDTLAKLTTWLDPLSEHYGVFLRRVLQHRWKVIFLAAAICGGSLALGTQLGVDFMAQADQAMIILEGEAAPGTSLHATDQLFAQAEEIIEREAPEALVVASEFGSGEGFGALFGASSHKGIIRIRLRPRAERERSQFEIERVLREKLGVIAGLDVHPMDQGLGALGGGGDVVVKVFADDLDLLRSYGQKLTERVKKIEGAVDVKFSMQAGRPELQVKLDRDQIRILGLTPAVVAGTINTFFMGSTGTMYREAGDEYRVLVRAPRAVRQDIQRLRNLPVITPFGGSVPLSTVASINEALGPIGITRENQRRLGRITMRADEVDLGTLIERVNEALLDVPEEPGTSLAIGGTAEDLIDSFMALGIAILVAILLVYMVMASPFESLLEPFVILFAVPLAGAGVILALWITDTTVQTTVLIGVVLLSGVVVNNGIVLLDVLKHRRLAGEDLIEAAVHAGRMRLRPILMTTLTTVLGMVPLSIGFGSGGEIWAPMARAVIGGLSLSAVLTLVVVPTGYVMIAGFADRRRARRRARLEAKEAAKEAAREAKKRPALRAVDGHDPDDDPPRKASSR